MYNNSSELQTAILTFNSCFPYSIVGFMCNKDILKMSKKSSTYILISMDR
jgi:hypothetical protein